MLTQQNDLLDEHNVAVASVVLVGLVRALHGACQETVPVLSLRLTWGILTLFPQASHSSLRASRRLPLGVWKLEKVSRKRWPASEDRGEHLSRLTT